MRRCVARATGRLTVFGRVGTRSGLEAPTYRAFLADRQMRQGIQPRTELDGDTQEPHSWQLLAAAILAALIIVLFGYSLCQQPVQPAVVLHLRMPRLLLESQLSEEKNMTRVRVSLSDFLKPLAHGEL